jgi:hypothetical protein
MRKNRDCEIKPSPRQGINMGKLLLPPYIRNGHLTFNDLLNSAVITSHIDCQKIAEKIAVDILMNLDQEQLKETTFEGDDLLSILSGKTEEIYVTPHGIGLENEYTPSHNSEVDQFDSFENKPDIGVGPGEDEIVKVAVKALRSQQKEQARKILAELLKEKLMKLGREFERKEEWSRQKSLTPFEYGEDPELIDEERSLENILDLGRSINEIRYNDFLMKQKHRLKRTIIYILDVSNTMFYDHEGINSINYSILSLIPLMWGLKKEKWGLTLYESNTHVIKDLYDDYNMEPILEDLVIMVTSTTTEMEKRFSGDRGTSTWGGTVPGKSLNWAYEEITDINDRSDRMIFIFSDFVLSEPGQETKETLDNYRTIEKMTQMGIRVCACVSPLAHKSLFSTYTKGTLEKLREIGVSIIETYSPTKFLEEAQKFIEEKY